MINHKVLLYALEVCREGSVVKAAEKLYISQPNLSKIIYSECHIGIIRCDRKYENNFRRFFDLHSLAAETLCEAGCVAVFAEDSFLADPEKLTSDDLSPFFEVRQSRNFVPDVSESQLRSVSDDLPGKIIYVSDSMAQTELVSRNSGTYMIVPPLSQETLKKHKLIQKDVEGMCRESVDFFIRSENYALTKTDNAFLDELMISKMKYKQEVLL